MYLSYNKWAQDRSRFFKEASPTPKGGGGSFPEEALPAMTWFLEFQRNFISSEQHRRQSRFGFQAFGTTWDFRNSYKLLHPWSPLCAVSMSLAKALLDSKTGEVTKRLCEEVGKDACDASS